MSKIVEQTENGFIIQMKSGKEREFYPGDFAYPDPRIGDEVVVYKDKDGYPTVDLKEYYEADHETIVVPSSETSKHGYATQNHKNHKDPDKKFHLKQNKFGLISIILAVVSIFTSNYAYLYISIVACIVGIIGIFKDKKRVVSIIGIVLSCFIFFVGIGSSESSNDNTAADNTLVASTGTTQTDAVSDSSNAASTDYNKEGWIVPQYGDTRIFGNITYPDITTWNGSPSEDSITYYPYGQEAGAHGIFSIGKNINTYGMTDAAYENALEDFNGNYLTTTNKTIGNIGDAKYLVADSKSSDNYMVTLVHLDDSYAYFFSGLEDGPISNDMSEFLGNFARQIQYTETSLVPVYSDDRVTIYYKGVTKNGIYFDIQNKTDVNITIQADSLSVNAQSVNDIGLSSNVAPQSTGTILAKCSVAETNAVTTVSGQLRVIDFNRSFDSYDASFVNIQVVNVDNVSDGSQSSANDLTLLYQDDRVKIFYYGIESTGITFQVENLTDVDITLQADSVSVNGTSYNDISMSDDVAPQSTGTVKARCNVAVPDTVQTIGGQLRVIDFNDSFESYDASFSNIAIQ